jgi:hypothetical protein
MHQAFREPSLQQRFERDGYVVIDFFKEAEVNRLLEIWESLPSDLGGIPFSNTIMSSSVEYRQQVHEQVADVFRQATDKLLDQYRICLCSFNAKLPQHEGGVVQLHQDWTFVDESRYQAMAIWCPLVEVTADNGCLRVVPGSHRLNNYPRGFQEPFPYTDLLPSIERDYLVEIPMKGGQAFVYTQTLFHSSPPNRSDRLRLAAGALAIPEKSRLRFLMGETNEEPRQLAVYEVADDFYRTYLFGSVPDESLRAGVIDGGYEPVSETRLREVLGERNANTYS